VRQSFRPYTIVIASASTTTEKTVTLKDTSGNPLACNYISIAVSGTDKARTTQYRAAIAPNDITTPKSNFDSTLESIDVTASGVPSVIFTASQPGEFLLSDKDRVDTVHLQSYEAGGTCVYFITYGQISVGNNLRDQERPVGS
jgi:hypothetical protein